MGNWDLSGVKPTGSQWQPEGALTPWVVAVWAPINGNGLPEILAKFLAMGSPIFYNGPPKILCIFWGFALGIGSLRGVYTPGSPLWPEGAPHPWAIDL